MKQLTAFLSCFLFLSLLNSQVVSVSGRIVDAETGIGVPGASIISGDVGTSSNEEGYFSLDLLTGSDITVSRIGYEPVTVIASVEMTIELMAATVPGEEIFVLANRAIPGVTPTAFSTLSADEIAAHYSFQDVPMILATEPGVFAYSESGNGTGYSYVSIRGFEQSRIAVMLDNVPLNDNESHQVYWVDHGDILSDAKDVQIQRGIGNSLYGSAAFGGSINIISGIRKDDEDFTLTAGSGSYGTQKLSASYGSGNRFGNKLSITARLSKIESDGYRDYHHSLQQAFSFAAEYCGGKATHQFRSLLGYENTDLVWDGVYGDDIDDRELRRKAYKGFTDDFFQQVYSLNSRFKLSESTSFHNTVYLVKGSGYYEAEKFGKSFYDYNLDTISDTAYGDSTTDLLRRKWIVNRYFGVVPQWTLKRDRLRLDLGGEIRFYEGDHFGDVSQFSASELADIDEFRYYEYTGTKNSYTLFAHIVYNLTDRLLATADLQFISHRWNMNQEPIGHAAGHQISADWNFVNPRFGLTYRLNERLSIFGSYGKAEKEPADDQIINADEWSFTPGGAYPERIYDAEFGLYQTGSAHSLSLNLYRIKLENEVIQTISFEEEGYYEYSQVDETIHQGVELDASWQMSSHLKVSTNGAISQNFYAAGELKGNLLSNRPAVLANATAAYTPFSALQFRAHVQHVGKRYIDSANSEENAIAAYTLLNLGASYRWKSLKVSAKVHNVLDSLYVTHGEDWGWGWIAYWPGATRNFYLTLSYDL